MEWGFNSLKRDYDFDDTIFISDDVYIIFCLLELDSQNRLDKLGINISYYSNRNKAYEWYSNTKRILNYSSHKKADIAIKELDDMYNNMIK